MSKNDSKTAEKNVEENKQLSAGVGALVVAPDFMDASDFGAGLEGISQDSFAIPFLQILQKMSPLVDEDSPKHIEGAKAGMIYNTVTGKLYDGKKGLVIIPCAFKRSYVQWGARDAGGGFKGEFTPEEISTMLEQKNSKDIVAVDGRYFKPDDKGAVDPKKADYYADTRTHFVIVIDPDTNETSYAILALSSTQRKSSAQMLTMLRTKKVDTANGKRTPPTFANLVRMTTVGQQNEKGSWSLSKFALEGMVTEADVYAEARAFYQAYNSGKAKADFTKAGTEHADEGGVSDEAASADNF